ncbi:hypothetical protein QBC44DRAFT_233286 [Cladorrhinum sp. PSN332]|nr:hypothetical protein QBC44DRAFT_233286 [Cladorrhinum sp. PSN332]
MTTEPEIYPQYCFHLSPTLDHWCHFRAADLVRLKSHPGFQGQDIYFHQNHPIKWVRVCGLVIAIHQFDGRRIYTIDDSSGATIDCVLNIPRSFGGEGPTVGTAEWNYKVKEDTTGRKFASVDGPIDIGHVLDIKGNVDEFRDEKQVVPAKIKHLRNTQQEAQFWEKTAQLRRDVLNKPWVLDPKVVRALRREAEGKKLKRRETGLEKQGTRRRREIADMEETSNPHPQPRHRETGLEPATKRRKVEENEKSHVTRPRRETGLESIMKRPTVNEEEQAQVARPRRVQTGLEPIPKRKVVEDETSHSIRAHHATGLERTASGQNTEVKMTHGTRPPHRETGLEPRSERHQVDGDLQSQDSRPRRYKTGLESATERRKVDKDELSYISYPLKLRDGTALEPTIESSEVDKDEEPQHTHPRVTGLERQGVTRDRQEARELQQRARKTGLEKQSQAKKVSREREAAKPLTVRSRITGLERQPLQAKQEDRKPTGLENQYKRSQPQENSRSHRRTVLEGQAKSKTETDTIVNIHSHRRTGLEGQTARKKEVSLEKQGKKKESDLHPIAEGEDDGGKEDVNRWDIGRPGKQVLVRGRMRTTGLERRVKAVTRVPPVTDQYDATD